MGMVVLEKAREICVWLMVEVVRKGIGTRE